MEIRGIFVFDIEWVPWDSPGNGLPHHKFSRGLFYPFPRFPLTVSQTTLILIYLLSENLDYLFPRDFGHNYLFKVFSLVCHNNCHYIKTIYRVYKMCRGLSPTLDSNKRLNYYNYSVNIELRWLLVKITSWDLKKDHKTEIHNLLANFISILGNSPAFSFVTSFILIRLKSHLRINPVLNQSLWLSLPPSTFQAL